MGSKIIQSVLQSLDSTMELQNSKIFISIHNAICHPVTLQSRLTDIKFVFLPKHITS